MANPVEIATICLNPARKRNPRGPRVRANSPQDAIGRRSNDQSILNERFSVLLTPRSPRYPWPGQTRSEFIAGAILTQGASLADVERHIANLRGTGRLGPELIERSALSRLERLIRPSGDFHQEGRKLKGFPHGRHIEERR